MPRRWAGHPPAHVPGTSRRTMQTLNQNSQKYGRVLSNDTLHAFPSRLPKHLYYTSPERSAAVLHFHGSQGPLLLILVCRYRCRTTFQSGLVHLTTARRGSTTSDKRRPPAACGIRWSSCHYAVSHAAKLPMRNVYPPGVKRKSRHGHNFLRV